jgi:hypothetical protein
MENIILNIIFYFLLTFLCFLMIAENVAKNKSNRIREEFTSFQQVINTDPLGRKHSTWDNLKPVHVPNNEFNVLKYIDEGIKKHSVSTVQDIYSSNFQKYNSRSLK